MMRILVDANFLIYLIDRRTGGTELDKNRRTKLFDLVDRLERSRGTILIPTPVLAEYLLNAGLAARDIIEGLRRHRRISIVAFDEMAALEAALLHRRAWDTGGHKRAPLPEDTDWQRIKVDWQVVAIAKVHHAHILTNDGPLCRLAKFAGVPVDLLDDMPLPASARQMQIEGVESVPPQAVVRLESIVRPIR